LDLQTLKLTIYVELYAKNVGVGESFHFIKNKKGRNMISHDTQLFSMESTISLQKPSKLIGENNIR